MTQIKQDDHRFLKGASPVTPSVVEGAHVAHTQWDVRCLGYARNDKRKKSVQICPICVICVPFFAKITFFFDYAG